MSIIIYDLNLPLLRINDMVKISLAYPDAYCHQSQQFVGKKVESFWTQLIEHNLEDDVLKVMVSNYCNFSLKPQEPPLQYQDYIKINKKHIKEHKSYQNDNEKKQRDQQVQNIGFLIDELPESEKKLLNSMSCEQRYRYWEQHYNTRRNQN